MSLENSSGFGKLGDTVEGGGEGMRVKPHANKAKCGTKADALLGADVAQQRDS